MGVENRGGGEMTKREEMWAKVHELSCSHAHMRADECPICCAGFAEIIDRMHKEETGEK
jgi:hypothetical protein